MNSVNNNLITLHDVTMRYTAHRQRFEAAGGEIWQLGPVNASVAPGEIVGLRGRNGAGKSTLLKLMAGVLRPASGIIRYAPGVRDHIGYVPQDLSLYESLTGLENLRFWGSAAGLSRREIRERSGVLLASLDLSDKAGEKVSSYSGGMKRRLHLASALIAVPRLLLLDEPTVGADPASVERILQALVLQKGEGCGIVLISHQSGELERVCDRVITLENGRQLETLHASSACGIL